MDLKQEMREEQVAAIEKLVSEKIPGASCKRTPNVMNFTLPLSATSRFPGTLVLVSIISAETLSCVPMINSNQQQQYVYNCTLHYIYTKALFDALDARAGEATFASANGVQAYGVAMTNLEQVFLRLGVLLVDRSVTSCVCMCLRGTLT